MAGWGTTPMLGLSAGVGWFPRQRMALAVRMAVQCSRLRAGLGVPVALVKPPQPPEVLPRVGALRIVQRLSIWICKRLVVGHLSRVLVVLDQPAERLGILRKWPSLRSLLAPDVPAAVVVLHGGDGRPNQRRQPQFKGACSTGRDARNACGCRLAGMRLVPARDRWMPQLLARGWPVIALTGVGFAEPATW